MLAALREDLKFLKAGTPGRRFRDLHKKRHLRAKRPKLHVALVLGLGTLLLLASPIVGLIPGPGGVVFFAGGAALIGCEVQLVARLLDWSEPKLRAGWERVKRMFKRASTAAPLIAFFAAAIAGLG